MLDLPGNQIFYSLLLFLIIIFEELFEKCLVTNEISPPAAKIYTVKEEMDFTGGENLEIQEWNQSHNYIHYISKD